MTNSPQHRGLIPHWSAQWWIVSGGGRWLIFLSCDLPEVVTKVLQESPWLRANNPGGFHRHWRKRVSGIQVDIFGNLPFLCQSCYCSSFIGCTCIIGGSKSIRAGDVPNQQLVILRWTPTVMPSGCYLSEQFLWWLMDIIATVKLPNFLH